MKKGLVNDKLLMAGKTLISMVGLDKNSKKKLFNLIIMNFLVCLTLVIRFLYTSLL